MFGTERVPCGGGALGVVTGAENPRWQIVKKRMAPIHNTDHRAALGPPVVDGKVDWPYFSFFLADEYIYKGERKKDLPYQMLLLVVGGLIIQEEKTHIGSEKSLRWMAVAPVCRLTKTNRQSHDDAAAVSLIRLCWATPALLTPTVVWSIALLFIFRLLLLPVLNPRHLCRRVIREGLWHFRGWKRANTSCCRYT
jgi:hypothetical protein